MSSKIGFATLVTHHGDDWRAQGVLENAATKSTGLFSAILYSGGKVSDDYHDYCQMRRIEHAKTVTK